MEAVFRMTPRPTRVMRRPAACAHRKTPVRLISHHSAPIRERQLKGRDIRCNTGVVQKNVDAAETNFSPNERVLHWRLRRLVEPQAVSTPMLA